MTTLLEFDIDHVKDFWGRFKFRAEGSVLENEEVYEYLNNTDSEIDLETQIEIFSELSNYLFSKNLDVLKFRQSFFKRVSGSFYMSAKNWLNDLNPFMQDLFVEKDLRRLLLNIYDKLPKQFGPQSTHELIFEDIDDEHRHALMMFELGANKNFNVDYESWVLPWLIHSPNIIGMPSYEDHRMLCDQRSIFSVISEDKLELSGNQLFYKGDNVGYIHDFEKFWISYGLNMNDFRFEARDCIYMIKDIYTEDGEVRLLDAGCVYNAPVTIVELRYKKDLPKPTNPISILIDMLELEEMGRNELIQKRHKEIVEESNAEIQVRYSLEDESISINGKHFIKGVPAKILRKVLSIHKSEGRTEFYHREFKKDPEICLDVYNPNFEGRLQRLMEKLKTEYPEVSIEKQKRGSFNFNPFVSVSYAEE